MSTITIKCPLCGKPHFKPNFDGNDEQEFCCDQRGLFNWKTGDSVSFIGPVSATLSCPVTGRQWESSMSAPIIEAADCAFCDQTHTWAIEGSGFESPDSVVVKSHK